MNVLELFKDVEAVIFDVDGVLSPSNLLVLENGQLLRQTNSRDGYAIKYAIRSGLKVAIITGGKSDGIIKRYNNLGVLDIFAGVDDKVEALEDYLYAYDLNPKKVLYVGDDLPDYEVMQKIGIPCCPNDAAEEIKALSKYISPVNGGYGVARDILEKVMKLNGTWMQEKTSFSNE
ncbi:MAG: 3-deoxy-D-manno-octulosonate 8-phosphate phosphatase (KDO 8-P phosphatase) [Cognaticolwellia sp.]